MRFWRVFIEQVKTTEGEILWSFRGLEEVLDIEFPASFFYPDLVSLIIDGQVVFDNLVGCLLGGWF